MCLRFEKMKNYIRGILGLLNQESSSAIYIVEYPKSGITWLSFLISNALLLASKSKMRTTFFNVQMLIPDVHLVRTIPKHTFWGPQFPKFIKSHSEYTSRYKNVIYIVRDPLSVMKSYYRYNINLGIWKGDFEEFVLKSPYGLKNWMSHLESWLKNSNNGFRLHLVKYEDLVDSPLNTLSDLLTNLGIVLDEKILKQSISYSSVSEMRQSEDLFRRYNPGYRFDFVKGGKDISIKVTPKVEAAIDRARDRFDSINDKI